ncbi:dynein axonemal heavy chain 17-like [Siniperca chuatsi]|uniref:dynein axonemal heavy chain 17-like n=1 Tax=Siniperca chuatsi TaxID=119488 RepID=UPI001CE1DD36|nr:dynein axonemal heavy chain 17-like [Siniperca chuatsi]XP_044075485.1 dynein axonemal heavy chain 17-like [Siniperca chuatsi]XP_044075486.1 dynein axonemal heavy chain 17-like [Siniperca chuatsi]
MDGKDERLDPVRSFTVGSLRLDPETWREFVSQEDNQVTFTSFFNAQDYCNLYICRDSQSGLSVSLDFPKNVQTKVVCVSKTAREVVTKENARKILIIQEVEGEDAMSFIIAVSEEVTCPLLRNPETSGSWAAGVAEEALRFMERQKNEALVMKSQIEGRTFLPYPGALRDDALHDDALHDDALHDDPLHDDDVHDDPEGRKVSDVKLLHACDSMVIEWAELVSEFLQQDSSQPVLDGLKPLPSEEFSFWKNRLKNLHFIQQQLLSSRAQQVASIVQKADSVYWSTLRDIYRDVQEGLKEAEDVSLNLNPLQEKLEEVEQVEYQQLGDNMAAVMEEVRLVWIRSEFYCKPCRMVVLLQEICNLFIQTSRKFLRGEEVMHGLVSDPGPVLDDVRLVIGTLQSLREAYTQCRTQLENQKQDGVAQSWDFPSHLVLMHLDNFLKRLHSIQEVFCVSLQLYQLDQTVLSGVSGRMWTDVVQDVYQHFVCHVTVLSDCNCDPTDTDDQSFELHLDQFQVQMSDLEKRLVSVLSRAFEDCCSSSSAAKLVKMFGFVLDRPLIQDQLRPHLIRLVKMVLVELDQTELLFYSQREKSETFSRFSPTAAARLCWTQQLRLRAEDALNNYRTVQHLYLDSGESQLVLQRFQQIVDLLQDFRDQVRSDWSCQLDSDCGFILEQPLLQHNQQGMLGVNCSHKLEAALRELRYVSRETDVELRPHAARLFTCRDDITQSYLSLSHMVSCYNQVVSDVIEVELPLIQDQLQDLNHTLSELQRNTWSCEGVQHLVGQQRERVLIFSSTVSEARANMDAMTHIIQGWAELHLLQHSDELLLEGGATEQSYRRIREEGQQLLRLTQVNRSLYGTEDSSESWIKYLDHIDDKVQGGLFQLLLRSLHFLSDNMNPQSCSAALLAVRLQLQETGSVFEPSVGDGLSDLLKTIITDIYTAASLPPRISVSRQGNYQVSLQQSPDLSALEEEVMHRLLQVREEAEHLRAGLDRYSYLWQSDRRRVMQEFLTYSRQLGPEELEAVETPPTLKDFQREIQSLHRLSSEVTHLDDVIVLHSWLQVDLRPFRDSLLSIIHDWRHMYTEYLLDSVSDSLQRVTQRGDDDEEPSSSSRFPLTETIILLEAAGVELPEHLSAQLQC